ALRLHRSRRRRRLVPELLRLRVPVPSLSTRLLAHRRRRRRRPAALQPLITSSPNTRAPFCATFFRMWFFDESKLKMPSREEALPGRAQAMAVPERHFVLGTSLVPPWPAGHEEAVFGMGCFWGAERKFWKLPGVYSTAVGY